MNEYKWGHTQGIDEYCVHVDKKTMGIEERVGTLCNDMPAMEHRSLKCVGELGGVTMSQSRDSCTSQRESRGKLSAWSMHRSFECVGKLGGITMFRLQDT